MFCRLHKRDIFKTRKCSLYIVQNLGFTEAVYLQDGLKYGGKMMTGTERNAAAALTAAYLTYRDHGPPCSDTTT